MAETLDEATVRTLDVFRGWPTPLAVNSAEFPDGPYGRLCWLPLLGPTSWLLWGILARPLALSHTDLRVDLDQVAVNLGVAAPSRHGRKITRAVKRLCYYDLARRHTDAVLVRLTGPAVPLGLRDRLPDPARRYHDKLFGPQV